MCDLCYREMMECFRLENTPASRCELPADGVLFKMKSY